jgi:hypothetical protein
MRPWSKGIEEIWTRRLFLAAPWIPSHIWSQFATAAQFGDTCPSKQEHALHVGVLAPERGFLQR